MKQNQITQQHNKLITDINTEEAAMKIPTNEETNTYNIKKTCIYLRNAQMIKQPDSFSQNDAFVKVIPDFDDKRSVRSATVRNENNATWNEQICFDGTVQEIEFHVYDVDDLGIGISEKNIGSGNIQINPQKQHSDLRIRLGDISNHYVGTLLVDVMYIYDKSSSTFQIVGSNKETETEVIKTCVGIIKSTLYVNADRFSENDVFVKVTPDFQTNEEVNTKTVRDNNNPEWGQVLCFKGSIDNLELYLYDVDNHIISKDATQLGSTMYGLDGEEHENVELHLFNTAAKDIGSLFINIFYVHGPKAKTTNSPTLRPTLKPTVKPTLKPTTTKFSKPINQQ